MTEVAVKSNFGITLRQLHRTPHVLRNRRPVRFNERGQPILFGSIQYTLHQGIHFAITFHAPSNMEADTFIPSLNMLLKYSIRFPREIHAVQAAERHYI